MDCRGMPTSRDYFAQQRLTMRDHRNDAYIDRGPGVLGSQLLFSEARPARIMLIDDHAILREGLIALSEMERDLKVVGQAGSIADGLTVALSTRPDLIITDLSLPGSTGLQGIVELRQRCPESRVLVLTMHDSEEYIRAALSAGAQGYVLKDATRAELIHAVRAVLA